VAIATGAVLGQKPGALTASGA